MYVHRFYFNQQCTIYIYIYIYIILKYHFENMRHVSAQEGHYKTSYVQTQEKVLYCTVLYYPVGTEKHDVSNTEYF